MIKMFRVQNLDSSEKQREITYHQTTLPNNILKYVGGSINNWVLEAACVG